MRPATEPLVAAQPTLGDLAAKLDAVQQKLAAPPPKPWHERYVWLLSPAVTVLLFFCGYFLKDAVTLAMQERQLQLNAAEAVQSHIQGLARPGASRDELTAVAVALAEYGVVAVGPLVRQLRLTDQDGRAAVAAGIQAVAFQARAETCEQLIEVLDARRRDYPLRSHIGAARLLGDLRCREALPAIDRYLALMPGENGNTEESFAGEVQDGRNDAGRPDIPRSSLDDIGTAIATARASLMEAD